MATLEDYGFGHITVDGVQEKADLIVLPHRVVRKWRRRESHLLQLRDLRDVMDELPGRLIVGIGSMKRMRLGAGLVTGLQNEGVEVEALPSGEAVARYLELDPEETALALHLTC